MATADDEILFLDEIDGENAQRAGASSHWKMLIVDDEPEVHSITRLVLADFTYKGRPAQFLSAYSAAEAQDILDREPDIAVILLDVVMETENAGLNLVRHIRNDLMNRRVRIILRTGQPGQAPERAVILDYDINDYKAKTQLTAQQLFTATVAALRSYEDMVTIDTNRIGLEKIIEASSSLFQERSLKLFAAGVLTQLGAIIGIGADAVLCTMRGRTPLDPVGEFVVLAGSGRFEASMGRPAAEIGDETVVDAVVDCLKTKTSNYDHGGCVLYIRSPGDREGVVFLRTDRPVSDLGRRLIELFCRKISIGFDNLALYEQSQRTQMNILAMVAEATDVNDARSSDLRLARIAKHVAQALRRAGGEAAELDDETIAAIGLAAVLHDVGNARIDRSILDKPGPLGESEKAAMQAHAIHGADLLSRAVSTEEYAPCLHLGMAIARSHHEAWDGSGYPDALSGTRIPLAARIVAVADAYDALTRPRPWRAAYSHGDAIALIRAASGRRYDPAVVDALGTVSGELSGL